jgi:hypothetical protein
VLKRDDLNAPGFLIPDGTELPARGFLAFHESALAPDRRQRRHRLALRAGRRRRHCDRRPAPGRPADRRRARPLSDGDARWNILETPTPGAANTPRRPAPVVLNEIMYNPISEDKDEEFVELFNPGAQSVNSTAGSWGRH